MRVLARVLKEFLPVFSTAFECFWWPSVPMLSMGYDPKHSVTAEVAGSSPVVPAIHSKEFKESLAVSS